MADTSDPRRVALFLPNLSGGGAERVALATIRDLLARGFEVDCVLLQAEGELLQLLPTQVRIFDLRAAQFRNALFPLARYFRERRPGAAHVFMWPLTVIALAAGKLSRWKGRLVTSDHVAWTQNLDSVPQRLAFRLTTRLLYPFADKRIVCSSVGADDLAHLSGIARDRFDVITNVIEVPPQIATIDEVEALWAGSKPRLITVGSLKPQKNHQLLLEAFANLKEFPEAKLLILGEGQLRPQIEGRARELGIDDRVILPGFAIDPWPYLASADLFVLSSDFEGFPLVLPEAMAAGLTVVSTDCVSGPREMLNGGEFGYLVPCHNPQALAEAIAKALRAKSDPERNKRRALEMAGPRQMELYAKAVLGPKLI